MNLPDYDIYYISVPLCCLINSLYTFSTNQHYYKNIRDYFTVQFVIFYNTKNIILGFSVGNVFLALIFTLKFTSAMKIITPNIEYTMFLC